MPARSEIAGFALCALFVTLLAAPLKAVPSLRFALENGAKVSDVQAVIIHVNDGGNAGIDRVEFTVDGQLKATDSSVPYSFDWDTLEEKEGDHALSAVVYDSDGKSAQAQITVRVDNELGKGPDVHADAALAALKANDLPTAMRMARRALKLDPAHLRGARALAGCHERQGEPARALAVMEKASIPDNEIDARADLVTLYLETGDASGLTDTFLVAAESALPVYRKLLAARALAVKTDGSPAAEAIRKGDAFFARRFWEAAIEAYARAGSAEEGPMPVVNRLLLAYLQAGRVKDVERLYRTLMQLKRADDVTRAVMGLYLLRACQPARAREFVQSGVENGILASLIVAAYADLILKPPRQAQQRANQAVALAPNLPEIQLLRASAALKPLEGLKAALHAATLDPSLPEVYALRGFNVLRGRDPMRFAASDALFAFALKRDPTNSMALLGAALSYLEQRRPNEAEPLLKTLVEQEKAAPDVCMALALKYNQLDKQIQVQESMRMAAKLDGERWRDDFVPTSVELTRRVSRYRFPALLSPASLYPKSD